MGQYYMPMLISDRKTEIFYSHDYDNGLKLMEHSWIGNNFMNVITSQIYKNPKKVIWMGDYADGVEEYDNSLEIQELFKLTQNSDNYEKNKIIQIDQKEMDEIVSKGFLINHTQKIYINMKKYIEESDRDGWIVNPLSLLTCVGNGQGGGDYYSDIGISDIGTWALDLIEFSDTFPSSYLEEEYCFMSKLGL